MIEFFRVFSSRSLTILNSSAQALQHCRKRHNVKFTKYDQSSQCTSITDSSVSYAAAIVTA